MVTAQRPCAGGEEAPREKLNAFFAEHPRLAIAFSGGLDSRFLCFSALRAGASVLALHARGPHIPEYETREAVDFAENLHLPLIVFDTDPLTLPDAAHNTKRRCYACKKNLLSRIRTLLAERGETERTLCDGTNHSDLAVFRPGLLALQEEGVLSPLALSGYDKPLIREKAVEEGMALPSFPPRPCLLTRYAYGLCPERAVLAALGRAEKKLLDLKNGEGGRLLGDFRLRLTPDPVLQCTRFLPEWREPVGAILLEEGFSPWTVKVTERVSGFFDTDKSPDSSGKSGM